MAFSGGIFSRLYSFTADAAASIPAQPSRFDAELGGMATGLTNCITRDGQSPALASLPMGGYKFTGLGVGAATGESVNYDQLILKADLAALVASTGAAMIGAAGGSTVQAQITALNGAISGVNYNDVSTTSLTISVASKVLTVSTAKSFTIGQFVTIANTPTPSNYMYGQITAYNSGTGSLTVNVTSIGGTGTFTAWTIALAATSTSFSGGVLTSQLTTVASAVGNAGFTVPHGVAPTAPVNGDVWTTTTAVFVRINGVTKTLADTSQITSFTGGTLTSLLTTVASATGTAGLNIPHGAAPTAPVNGDTWSTLTGLFSRINGVTVQFATNAAVNTSLALKQDRSPAVQTVTSAATVTPDYANDAVDITALATGLTLANWTGSPPNFYGMVIRIKDNATAQTIAYGVNYTAATNITLPTTTVVGKTHEIALEHNATSGKHVAVSVISY